MSVEGVVKTSQMQELSSFMVGVPYIDPQQNVLNFIAQFLRFVSVDL